MKSLLLKVVLPLFGIAAILGFITIVHPINKSDASWVEPLQHYVSYCGISAIGGVWVEPVGGDSCDSSYDAGVNIWTDKSNSNYEIVADWEGYWCNDKVSSCVENLNQPSPVTFDASTAKTYVGAPTMKSSGQFAGLACGHYQDDFGFYVKNKNTGGIVCNYNIYQAMNHMYVNGVQVRLADDGYNNNAAWCVVSNNEVCTLPTPTPIPTNTPVPTATPIPTNTPTPSATPTPMPTSTPTPTPTHAPTPTPTTTTGCSGTQTGFNNNSNCQNQNQNQTQDQLQLQDQSQYQINGNNTLDNSSNNSSTNNSTNSNNINIQLDRVNEDPFEFVA